MDIPAIRPLQPGDAGAAADLLAAEWPHRAEEAGELRRGEYHPEGRHWAAADPSGGGLAAYAALWQVRGDRFRVDLVVAPGRRRRGIGGRVMEMAIAQAESAGAATLQARAHASAADALAFLERRGFAETMRMVGQRLDVVTIDPGRLMAYGHAVAARGFSLTTLAQEERRNPECRRALHDVFAAAQDGWLDPDPRPEPDEPITYDAFLHHFAQFPLDPEAFVIAKRGERIVGFAGSIGTAVHPEFRGRGLANALKARVALHARATGLETLETSTGNPAMARANENVGYRRTYTEVRLVRRIRA